ncbi:MAG TPA: hypothetical protein VGF55_17630 [Gemmataceae bacterium]|jgi:hypothetical protein
METNRPSPPRVPGWVLLAVVGMVVVLAAAVWTSGQLGRLVARQDAARRLTALGARVHWDCHLVRNGELYYVTDVHIDNPHFPDSGFALLRDLTKLKGLHLYGPRFSDATLDLVADLPDLQYLVLQDTSVTPAGIDALKARRPGLEVMVPERPKPGP